MINKIYRWLSAFAESFGFVVLCLVTCVSLLVWSMAGMLYDNSSQTSAVLPFVANVAWVIAVVGSIALFSGGILYFVLGPIVRYRRNRRLEQAIRKARAPF